MLRLIAFSGALVGVLGGQVQNSGFRGHETEARIGDAGDPELPSFEDPDSMSMLQTQTRGPIENDLKKCNQPLFATPVDGEYNAPEDKARTSVEDGWAAEGTGDNAGKLWFPWVDAITTGSPRTWRQIISCPSNMPYLCFNPDENGGFDYTTVGWTAADFADGKTKRNFWCTYAAARCWEGGQGRVVDVAFCNLSGSTLAAGSS